MRITRRKFVGGALVLPVAALFPLDSAAAAAPSLVPAGVAPETFYGAVMNASFNLHPQRMRTWATPSA